MKTLRALCCSDRHGVLGEESVRWSGPSTSSRAAPKSTVSQTVDAASRNQSMLKRQLYTDVTMTVQGRSFQLHRAVLAAASPVFDAMFRHHSQTYCEAYAIPCK